MDNNHNSVDVTKVGGGPLTKHEAQALHAVWNGTATAGDQRLCLNIIIHKFAMVGHNSFKEGSPDGTVFLAGRAFVGQQINYILSQNLGDIQ